MVVQKNAVRTYSIFINHIASVRSKMELCVFRLTYICGYLYIFY